MSVRVRTVVGFVTALAGLVMVAAPSGSASADDPYVFPSTNDANRELGLPHVNELSKGPGTVTLEFVNPTTALAFFEYRIDGLQAGTTPHPVVIGDVIHPGVCVEGDEDFDPPCEPDAITRTFSADATVEVRLALGGERDWDFDWTPFTVGPKPTGKADCKNGGWEAFGFRNQGECIRFVNAGKQPGDRGDRDDRSDRRDSTRNDGRKDSGERSGAREGRPRLTPPSWCSRACSNRTRRSVAGLAGDRRGLTGGRQAAEAATPLGARSIVLPVWWTDPSGRVQVATRSAVIVRPHPPS